MVYPKKINLPCNNNSLLNIYNLTAIYNLTQSPLLNRTSAFCFPFSGSICAEFRHMEERALRVPDTSEELQDMIVFVEDARTMGMIKLNDRIKVGVMWLACRVNIDKYMDDTLININWDEIGEEPLYVDSLHHSLMFTPFSYVYSRTEG